MDLQVDPDAEGKSEGIYKRTKIRSLKWSYLKAYTKKNVFKTGLSLHC